MYAGSLQHVFCNADHGCFLEWCYTGWFVCGTPLTPSSCNPNEPKGSLQGHQILPEKSTSKRILDIYFISTASPKGKQLYCLPKLGGKKKLLALGRWTGNVSLYCNHLYFKPKFILSGKIPLFTSILLFLGKCHVMTSSRDVRRNTLEIPQANRCGPVYENTCSRGHFAPRYQTDKTYAESHCGTTRWGRSIFQFFLSMVLDYYCIMSPVCMANQMVLLSSFWVKNTVWGWGRSENEISPWHFFSDGYFFRVRYWDNGFCYIKYYDAKSFDSVGIKKLYCYKITNFICCHQEILEKCCGGTCMFPWPST